MIPFLYSPKANRAVVIPLAHATDESAGFDLRANISTSVTLAPFSRILIDCGFSMELEPGTFGLVCPRSGLAIKHGITLLNAPGVIDSDYRGPVGAVLYNSDPMEEFEIEPGDRIAQLVIMRYDASAEFVPVSKLTTSSRGNKGFGSSGIS